VRCDAVRAHQSKRLDEFCRLLSVRTGLRVDETRRESIEEAVRQRMDLLNVDAPEQYCEVLDRPGGMMKEVEAVIPEVMRSDTIFFRNREHFELLKERLVPEILQRVGRDRSIRIWDAGCAAGEETYSTAILLDIYFRRFADGAHITGTDINRRALDIAEKGVYDRRSVKGLLNNELAYFVKSGRTYELKLKIKRRVQFAQQNLIEDLPSWKRAGLSDMDLVVCRDVLIYFEPEIAQRVIIQFYECMAPGGYLILGQAEGMMTVHSPFEHLVFEDTVYCRKQLLGHSKVISFYPIG
jgi:chemotaxis protein methyltransferase CheR